MIQNLKLKNAPSFMCDNDFFKTKIFEVLPEDFYEYDAHLGKLQLLRFVNDKLITRLMMATGKDSAFLGYLNLVNEIVMNEFNRQTEGN